MCVIDPARVVRIIDFGSLAKLACWEWSIQDHVIRMFELPAHYFVDCVILGVMFAPVQRPAFTADLPIRLEMYMVLLGVIECISDRYHCKAMICIDMES